MTSIFINQYHQHCIAASKHLAAWSSGMILAPGARGPGFNSRSSPFVLSQECHHCAAISYIATLGQNVLHSPAVKPMSAVGFEPTRSLLQWILSPPP